MIKRLSSVVAALATVCMASPSIAQSFSPSSGSVSATGQVQFQQEFVANCNLSMTVNPLSATTAPIATRSISGGDPICFLVVPYGSWKFDVVPGSTTSVAFTFGATSVNSCYGTIIVAWNNSTSTATFNNNTIPPVNPANLSCVIRTGFIRIPGLQII